MKIFRKSSAEKMMGFPKEVQEVRSWTLWQLFFEYRLNPEAARITSFSSRPNPAKVKNHSLPSQSTWTAVAPSISHQLCKLQNRKRMDQQKSPEKSTTGRNVEITGIGLSVVESKSIRGVPMDLEM
ncbi:hypothetical protein B9Z55_016108 [Caenorhabditis nigoni]|uniref:Uncharacterized protein n=1 Tax=Caenorhabditis nigoni TaxID=1611254 RepID=A0A2G5UD75_9PELO|nr:hypothetical protein B9Z55_016108 [Caenorhabditis nigoni]